MKDNVERLDIKRLATLTIVAFVWLEVLMQFGRAMAPRLLSVATGGPVVNTSPCYSPDCDFSIFWPAGVLARAGDFAGIYAPLAFLALRHHLLFAGAQRLDWIYPPPSLLPPAAVSLFSFQVAFWVSTVGLAAAAVAILRWMALPWSVIVVSFVSPAALWNFEMGQVEMFCGACVVAGLTQLETKPFPAGIFLGLLIFKPQAGLLAPVTALARWRFRAIAGGLVCAACVLVTVTLVLGFQVWTQYFRLSPAAARQIAAAAVPIGSERGVSVMWMMRSLGAGAAAALAVQAVCAMVALGLTVFVWRREALGVVERAALTVFLSLLALPYGFVDDMVAYSIMLTWLIQRRGWRIGLLDALLWLWPALCPIVYRATGVLLTPAVVALAVLSVGRRQDLLF